MHLKVLLFPCIPLTALIVIPVRRDNLNNDFLKSNSLYFHVCERQSWVATRNIACSDYTEKQTETSNG